MCGMWFMRTMYWILKRNTTQLVCGNNRKAHKSKYNCHYFVTFTTSILGAGEKYFYFHGILSIRTQIEIFRNLHQHHSWTSSTKFGHNRNNIIFYHYFAALTTILSTWRKVIFVFWDISSSQFGHNWNTIIIFCHSRWLGWRILHTNRTHRNKYYILQPSLSLRKVLFSCIVPLIWW